MSFADSPKYDRDKTEKAKEAVRKLKKKFLDLIYPNNNYMVYFNEYFPSTTDEKLKKRIRNVWNGYTCNDEVKKMMETIITKLEEKKK